MNPFQTIILALSGALMIVLVISLLSELIILRRSVMDELDLTNLLTLYERGLLLNADFNISYKPSANGSLTITSESITINQASKTYHGLREQNCNYDYLLITEEGVQCLKH